MGLQDVREEVIYVGNPQVVVLDTDDPEAVEALSLLVAVEGTPAASDRLPVPETVVDHEEFAVGVVSYRQDMPGEAQLPSRLDQTPACLDLVRQIRPLTGLCQPEQVIGQCGCPFGPLGARRRSIGLRSPPS